MAKVKAAPVPEVPMTVLPDQVLVIHSDEETQEVEG